MKQLDDLARLERRPYRYWYTDGLAEMASAGVFALLAIFFLLSATWAGGPLAALLAFILPLVIIGGGLLSRRIVAAAKARLTYRRTGYVAYRKPKKSMGWRAAVLAVVMAVTAVIVARRIELSLSWMLLIEGIAIGAGMAYPAYKYGLGRFYGLACLSLLAAVGAALVTSDAELGNAIYFATVAVGLFVSGGLTLLSYLRRTGPPAEDDHA